MESKSHQSACRARSARAAQNKLHERTSRADCSRRGRDFLKHALAWIGENPDPLRGWAWSRFKHSRILLLCAVRTGQSAWIGVAEAHGTRGDMQREMHERTKMHLSTCESGCTRADVEQKAGEHTPSSRAQQDAREACVERTRRARCTRAQCIARDTRAHVEHLATCRHRNA